MSIVDRTKRIVMNTADWSVENGFVIIKHNGEKMILNDSLSLVWLEIDENSSVSDIFRKIRKRCGDDVTDENIDNVVAESFRILYEEGLVSLADQDEDDIFSILA